MLFFLETEKIPVMRGQWFIDGTWQPLEEEESNLIEQEHLNRFKGQQLQESFDMEISKPVDGKEGKIVHITIIHFLDTWGLLFLSKNVICVGFSSYKMGDISLFSHFAV